MKRHETDLKIMKLREQGQSFQAISEALQGSKTPQGAKINLSYVRGRFYFLKRSAKPKAELINLAPLSTTKQKLALVLGSSDEIFEFLKRLGDL